MIIGLILAVAAGDPGKIIASHRIEPMAFPPCGPCCLYMASVAMGKTLDFRKMSESFGSRPDGITSFAEIGRVAQLHGITTVAGVVDTETAQLLKAPFIAHLSRDAGADEHFVLVLGLSPEGVVYIDPPSIARLDRLSAFEQRWTGNVLIPCDGAADVARVSAILNGAVQENLLGGCVIAASVALLLIATSKCRRAMMRRRLISSGRR